MNNKIIGLRDYDKPEELKKYKGIAHGICFAGFSASFKNAESDVIVIAPSVADLNKHWFRLFGSYPSPDTIQKAAAFSYHDMRGKRLFK